MIKPKFGDLVRVNGVLAVVSFTKSDEVVLGFYPDRSIHLAISEPFEVVNPNYLPDPKDHWSIVSLVMKARAGEWRLVIKNLQELHHGDKTAYWVFGAVLGFMEAKCPNGLPYFPYRTDWDTVYRTPHAVVETDIKHLVIYTDAHELALALLANEGRVLYSTME